MYLVSAYFDNHTNKILARYMEEIARKMPLSPINRPRWDCEVLKETGFAKVEAEENMGKRVWSLTEQMNYHSTPMFCVAARRA